MKKRIIGEMLPECLECDLHTQHGITCVCSTCVHHRVIGHPDRQECSCDSTFENDFDDLDLFIMGESNMGVCTTSMYSCYEPVQWESPDQLTMFEDGAREDEYAQEG